MPEEFEETVSSSSEGGEDEDIVNELNSSIHKENVANSKLVRLNSMEPGKLQKKLSLNENGKAIVIPAHTEANSNAQNSNAI